MSGLGYKQLREGGGLIERYGQPSVSSALRHPPRLIPSPLWPLFRADTPGCRHRPGLWPLWEGASGCVQVHLEHVPRRQLGLWAWTSSSVTAVAPCFHVHQSQTLSSIQASPGSPGAPLLSDLTTWPLVSFILLA